jgi:regulator of replication initiation timing
MTSVNPNLEILHANLDKRQLRLIKNRQAADLSRKKKKMEFMRMESRIKELEAENEELQTRIKALEEENQQLRAEKSRWNSPASTGIFSLSDLFSEQTMAMETKQPCDSLFSHLDSSSIHAPVPNLDILEAASPNSSGESTLYSDSPSPKSDEDIFNFVNLDFSETSTFGVFAVLSAHLDLSSIVCIVFDSQF